MASSDLINTIIAEAGGGGAKGITAATWAIAQRAAARGQTMDQVIRSGFDGFTNPGSGSRKAQQNQALRNQVERIISGVQSGSIPNPVPGADHFLSGNANPSWAKGMKLVATIDGQRYYASGQVPRSAIGHPIPPGELPSVASQLDVRRPAPTPASAATRDMALNSPQNTNLGLASFSRSAAVTPTSLQASLENHVRPQQNAVTPAIRRPQLPAMGTPDVKSLYNGIYPQAAPGAVPQSVIERGPARPPSRSSAEINSTVRSLQQSPALAAALAQRGPKLTDPGAINRSVDSLSNTPLAASLNRVAAGNARAPQSPIERGVSRVAPVPSSQIERGAPRTVEAPASPPRVTVSTPFTTPQSIIERSAPQTVASSPIGQPPATRTVQSVPMPAIRPSIPQSGGVERGVPRIATPAPGAVTASYLGPFQQMSQPNRLPAGALPFVAPVQNVAPMAPPITPTPSITNVAMPIPRPNIPQPIAVPRPVVQPVYRPPAQIAPTTHPQIQVMARAPAPVFQQAGGYFFAPNGSGGFTNVGRVNSSISPAQQYAMLNAGNGGPRTAADRSGKSLSQSGGQRSFME